MSLSRTAFALSLCATASYGCKTTGEGAKAATYDKASAPETTQQQTTNALPPPWVQLGPDGAVLVKVLTAASTCPSVSVDGATLPMLPRSTPTADFSVLVCQATLPAGTKSASLNGSSLTLPQANPHKILVVGDTGCEIKAAKGKVEVQDCNDPKKWAWAQVAATAAAEHPDLIIHVGDYHYREVACPDGDPKCSGAAVGDQWASWHQDFFTPAAPLLSAAPWIFVRGNHELCARAGKGWFYFLDPRPHPGACREDAPPYQVAVGNHSIAVIDSANDANVQVSLNNITPPTNAILWLALHRPFLTPGIDDEPSGPIPTLPATMQPSGKVGAVIAGHSHLLSLNTFTNGAPPELISGNGGTTLEKSHLTNEAFSGVLTQPGYSATQYYDYGYLTFEQTDQPGQWSVIAHDRSSAAIFQCTLQEGLGLNTRLDCKAAP